MKNIFSSLLLFSFILTTISSQAQEANLKGKWMLGGSVGVSNKQNFDPTFSYLDQDSKGVIFSPVLGYFINNKWQAGIRGIYNKVSQNSWNNQHIYQHQIFTETVGAELYVRRYIWMFDHFAFHLEAGGEYTQGVFNDVYVGSSQINENLLSVTTYLNPGFTLKVNKRIGIDFSTHFLRIGQKTSNSKTTSVTEDGNTDLQTHKAKTSIAKIANFETLLNDVQIGITIFI